MRYFVYVKRYFDMSFNEYQIHEISLGKMNDRLPCNIECLDDEKILA